MKSTKRSFVLSVLSLIMCFAMLIGTTYAWFTDSVTSGRNKIVAGNLDVELYHSVNSAATVSDANKVDGATNLFKLSENTLWEPGMVVYENFLVKNAGNLALKYRMTLDVYNANYNMDGHSLADILKVAILDSSFTGDRTDAQAEFGEGKTVYTISDFSKTGNLLQKDASDNYAIIIYWEPSDNDNEFNINNDKNTSDGNPMFIEFGINLVATQKDQEPDSFGNDYDANLSLPAAPKYIFTSATRSWVKDETNLGMDWDDGKGNTSNAPVGTNITLENEDITATSGNITRLIDTSNTSGSVVYNISYLFTTTTTTGDTSTSQSSYVTEFSKIVTNKLTIGTGFTNVKVTHSHGDVRTEMSPLSSETADGEGYYYNDLTGILTVKSKTYSDFIVSYTAPVTIQKNFVLDETGKKIVALGDYATEKVVIIPEGIEVIGKNVFKNDTSVEEIVFSSTVKTLEPAEVYDGMFATPFVGCNALKAVDMSKSQITTLKIENPAVQTPVADAQVFTWSVGAASSSLNTIKLPGTLTEISEDAFGDGFTVKNLYIPASVKTIGKNALYRAVQQEMTSFVENIYWDVSTFDDVTFGVACIAPSSMTTVHVNSNCNVSEEFKVDSSTVSKKNQPYALGIVKDYDPAN